MLCAAGPPLTAGGGEHLMTITLYDLAGKDGRCFSPFCWRARMALAHKGLDFSVKETGFTDIADVAEGASRTLPVIDDNGWVVADSFEIALYLERAHPDAPTLFDGEGGIAAARFADAYVRASLMPVIIRMCVKDIHDALQDQDKTYFRDSREKRFGATLEEVQTGREARVDALYDALAPLRMVLAQQPWIGGDGPLFADYIVFGALQWPRVASPFPMLRPDDPVAEWFARGLALHDGLGERMPAAA